MAKIRINSDSPFARWMEQCIQNSASSEEIIRGAPASSALGRLRDRGTVIADKRNLSFVEGFAIAMSENLSLYTAYLEEAGKDH